MNPRTIRLFLLLILVVAAGLRFYGLNWDEGQHAHPDERWIAMVAPTITWPRQLADLLDPRRSTLNPLWVPAERPADDRSGGDGGAAPEEDFSQGEVRNFSYGHLPLYLQSLAGHSLAAIGREIEQWALAREGAGAVFGQLVGEQSAPELLGREELGRELQAYGQYAGISLVGRVLSVLFDLGTVLLVYLIGKAVYDERVGVLGAALVATAVMHIQLSHFATFDVITTFFVTLSVYGAECVLRARFEPEQSAPIGPTLWAGAAAGLAVASKFSALPLLAVLVFAQLVRDAGQSNDQQMKGRDDRAPTVGGLRRRSWFRILLTLLAALLAFFVVSPFALLDIKLYLKQIIEQGRMVRGVADWPFTRQYLNTTPFLYQILQQVRWGLGWPLGIVAFAGFGWTVVRQFQRPRAKELIMLGWVIPYFLLTGTFMVKFMRYMLPLLPFVILMGAAMLWRLRDWGMAKWRNQGLAYLFCVVPYIVLLLSFLYALAFTRVYAQTHPWIQASRWIYDRVPDGAVIAVEHWDDHLPLSLPEERANPGEHGYRHVELPMYEPDSLAKFDLIRSRLREADYLVLSSNRLYRTIPRLPARYPVSSEFYRLLFAGEAGQVGPLGYVREVEFTAYPGFPGGLSQNGKGLQIVDDDADESFTVYDHPKPIVFRKVRDLDGGQWDVLFGEALAKTPVVPGQTDARTQGEPNLLSFLAGILPAGGSPARGPLADDPPDEKDATRDLLLDRPVGELPVVDDFGWNRWASESTVGAVLTWWLLVSALGGLAWPLTFVLFGGLRDRGYLLSRMVALLVIGYLVWLPGSLQLLKNGLPLTYAAIGVLTVVSALLLWRYQAEIRAWLRAHWRLVLLGEAIFTISFLAFVGIRILNPDLWQPWNGGEKLMDIAYLNSSMRSAYWPPPDPYYAHGYLNYYYYGQYLLSILIRLTGIRTAVAFNLAVPLLFAWTVSAAFSIGYTLAAGTVLPSRGPVDKAGSGHAGDSDRGGRRLTHGIAHGLLAVLCVAVAGNLASATQIIERLGWVASPTPWFGGAFTSRIPGLEPVVKAASGAGEILLRGANFPGFNYWDPSRVVGYTINEFPYWSFLFADLHPHMINIPFTLLVLALALNWLRRRPSQESESPEGVLQSSPVPDSEVALALSSVRYLWRRIEWGVALNVVLWPLALGALAPINSWDWPAYAGFCGLVLVYGHIRARGRRGIVPGILVAVALAGASLLFYAPFFQYYTPIFVGLGWSLGRTHTELGEFLTVWGFFLFVSITFLLILLARQRSRDPAPGSGVLRWLGTIVRHPLRLNRVEELYALLAPESLADTSRPGARVRHARPSRLAIVGLLLLLAAMVWWAWQGYWVLVLIIPLLVLVAALMVQRQMPDERRFVLALTFTAYLILVGVEFLYLKDHLDGDQQGWWRMNTLFKFYLQVWSMLGIAVGVSLPGIWQATERWRAGWRGAWMAAFTLLLVSVLLYPMLGTPARVADRFPGERPPVGTLDGMAFMTVGTYTWPDESNPIELWGDYQAIRWLQDNVPGTPVLAEAPIGYYREFGVRASSFAGLPTLLGMHESEQRHGWQVGLRSGQARDLYHTANLERTLELIRELSVEYVYVGPLERAEYPLTAAKFEELAAQGYLRLAYQNDLVTIYQVV